MYRLLTGLALAQSLASPARDDEYPRQVANLDHESFAHPARPATFKAVVDWENRCAADRSNLEGDALRE
jgi:hypothetical protein